MTISKNAAELTYIKSEWKKTYHEYKSIINLGDIKILAKLPEEVFKQEEFRDYLVKFTTKHIEDFLDEVSDGKLDWNNEFTELFFKLMTTKFKIDQRNLLHSILYTHRELEYFNFRDSLDGKKYKNLEEVCEQAVYYDIFNGLEENPRSIERYLLANDIKVGFFESAQASYNKVKDSIRVNQFERSLNSSKKRPAESINQQIRRITSEKFFEMALGHHLEPKIENYIIAGNDHSRESRLDRYYKKHFTYLLFSLFKGQCACCQVINEPLELDHFFIPKSKGGNFVMRHNDGYYVNNCIPLCRPCNASKGAKNFLDFFDADRLEDIVTISQSINAHINTHLVDYDDDDFDEPNRKAA